jgi:hypothetical protein
MWRTFLEGGRFTVVHNYQHLHHGWIRDCSRGWIPYQGPYRAPNHDHSHDQGHGRAIDASYGGINIPPLEDDEYRIFFHDINAAVNVGALVVSIFMDASGTIYAQDNNGRDVNLRTVKTTSYTYPYFDVSGVWHDGLFYLTFDDDATFDNVDLNNSAYWYYIQGVSDMSNLLQWT